MEAGAIGPMLRDLRRDASISAVAAGLASVLVGFGSIAIVLAAARSGHLSARESATWVSAIALGTAITSIGLSLTSKQPILVVWSTPGAALMISGLQHFTLAEAVGAYLLSAVLMTAIGATGLFGRLIELLPRGILAGLLAGVLLPFVLDAWRDLGVSPGIVGSVLVAFLLLRRIWPMYAVLGGVVAGVAAAAFAGSVHARVSFRLTQPVLTTPAFSLAAVFGLAIPLSLVAAASQNAPGFAVLRANGYEPDDRRILTAAGVVSFLLAPFGSPGFNVAAITAAMCAGPDAHPDPRRRYVAPIANGLGHLVIAIFAGGLVGLFAGLPASLIAAIAGIGLFGALSAGVAGAVGDAHSMEGAIVTLVVTASGVTIGGIGAAFWGLVFGVATHLLLTRGRRPSGSEVALDD
jgi:benzoate membrane transport protein